METFSKALVDRLRWQASDEAPSFPRNDRHAASGHMLHSGLIRRLWLILAIVGLVLSPVTLSAHTAAMPESAAMATSDCDHSPPVPNCDATCPPSMACPADYASTGLLIGAAYGATGSAGTGLPGSEAVPETPNEKPIFPPPRR